MSLKNITIMIIIPKTMKNTACKSWVKQKVKIDYNSGSNATKKIVGIIEEVKSVYSNMPNGNFHNTIALRIVNNKNNTYQFCFKDFINNITFI